MTNHQLIFTSCRRGIDGVNDGQQVFSYDAGFPREILPRLTPSLTYKGPDLPEGVAMSEALVPGYPKSFTYERLSDGLHHLALKTYLGKDYMGPSGRFGNFLSHDVLVEDLTANPMEFYGSSTFRTRMGFDEVNRTEAPDHLPVPHLKPGPEVSQDSVRVFLEQGNRWQSFTRMMACLLAGDARERRLLIRDDPENVVQWIAALFYCLPRSCGGDVSLSTYEYEPMNGERRVVGVIAEGTAYRLPESSRRLDTAFVFDLIDGTEPTLDLSEDFADFIEAGLLIAPESLEAFHRFVEESFPSYETADDSLFGAYGVYQQTRGELRPRSIRVATAFLSRYGTDVQQRGFLSALCERPDCVGLVVDQVNGPVILGFLNAVARDPEDLLELTFDLEGNLLDGTDPQRSLDTMWVSFFAEILARYPDQLGVIYRCLAADRRLIEAKNLFALALGEGQKEDAKSRFDEVISQLPSPADYPPFIDTYYAHAIDPADRMHLLRFIMANGVTFESSDELVQTALSGFAYGRLSDEQSAFVLTVWRWVDASGFDLRKCQRLWFLLCGEAITSAKTEPELQERLEWILANAAQRGMASSTEDPAFLEWVVPHIRDLAHSGGALYRLLTSIGIRPTSTLLTLLCGDAISKFELGKWLKVAECVYSFNDDRLLGQFGESCKKLSNREIGEIQKMADGRYAGHPSFMRSWQTVYAATQTTTGRVITAWIGRRGAPK